MIYTDLTKKALCISFEAHKRQLDKGGLPYVYHPYHLAEQMNDEYSVCAALLHDVVEDTSITLSDLRKYGFPEEVVEAVRVMTHADGVPYMEYISKIKKNPIARKVKLADLRHNSDTSRLPFTDEKTAARIEKYKKAIELLSEK